jgi:dienelactone hydrolase
VELVGEGFVVFAPDAIAFGERMGEGGGAKYHNAGEFFAANPQGSVMGKMAYDTSRAVDVLQALEMVDGERIGCIGHSHGAYGTLFGMIQDERIKAGVISCGVSLLRADPTPERWWKMTALMPRPMVLVVAWKDQIFPNTEPVRGAVEEVRKVYALQGAGKDLHGEFLEGGHSFPEAVRKKAYAMLKDALGR